MFYNGKAQIIKVFRCFLFVDEEMKKMFGVTSTLRIIVFLHNKLASYGISILSEIGQVTFTQNRCCSFCFICSKVITFS